MLLRSAPSGYCAAVRIDHPNEGEERAAVLKIVLQMQELERMKEPLWGETKDERDFGTGPNAQALIVGARLNPLLKKISPVKYGEQIAIERKRLLLNRELARHRFSLQVWQGNEVRWILSWRAASSRREKPVRPGAIRLDDGGALQMILDLARAGYLKRLRPCVHCGKWVFAKVKHQNFCSKKCQQKHFTQSEEWRAHRRKYMRGYYQRHLTAF
jgi:hypothetical protein